MNSTWRAIVLAIGVALPAVSGPSRQHYVIPAQRLDTALEAWAHVIRVGWSIDGGLKFPLSHSVAGDFGPEQALCKLLADTGFTFRHQGTYSLLPEALAQIEGVPLLAERCSTEKDATPKRKGALLSPSVINRMQRICAARQPERAGMGNALLADTGIQLMTAFDTWHRVDDRLLDGRWIHNRFVYGGPTMRIRDCSVFAKQSAQ